MMTTSVKRGLISFLHQQRFPVDQQPHVRETASVWSMDAKGERVESMQIFPPLQLQPRECFMIPKQCHNVIRTGNVAGVKPKGKKHKVKMRTDKVKSVPSTSSITRSSTVEEHTLLSISDIEDSEMLALPLAPPLRPSSMS